MCIRDRKFEALRQMDEEDLKNDVFDDADFDLDEETKTEILERLQALKADDAVLDETQVSDFDPVVIDAAAQVAAQREAQWPKWPALQKMLPGLRGLHEVQAQTHDEALAVKDAELAAKDDQPGAKDEQLATKDCLLYTSPSPRDLSTSRMPSSA